MTTLELLRGARNLLRAKKRWAQHYYAFDAQHKQVDCASPDAVCFCAFGALLRVGKWGDAYVALGVLGEANNISNTIVYNDAPERTHAEILAAFNKAIKFALAEEKENARLARESAVRS